MTRFFLGGASALAGPAAGSTFRRTSGADWAFGAAPSLGSGVTSGAGAGVAATVSSLGLGVTSGAGAGVAATASSLGSGVTSGAGAGVAATARGWAQAFMSGAGAGEFALTKKWARYAIAAIDCEFPPT